MDESRRLLMSSLAYTSSFRVAGDHEPKLMEEFYFCQNCYLGGPLDLSRLVEKRNEQAEAESTQATGTP